MKFIFDLDGTICFDGKTIDNQILEALDFLERCNHEVIFASARPYRDCVNVIGKRFENNYVIGLNGGTIHKDKKVIHHKTISLENYHKLVRYCLDHQLAFFIDGLYDFHAYLEDKIPFFPHVNHETDAKHVDYSEIEDPVKMVINVESKKKHIQALCKMLDEKQVDVMYHEKEGLFYINPNRVNKGIVIAEYFKGNYVAFGNDKNDEKMLEDAEFAVVIGNYPGLEDFAEIQIVQSDDLNLEIANTIQNLAIQYKES